MSKVERFEEVTFKLNFGKTQLLLDYLKGRNLDVCCYVVMPKNQINEFEDFLVSNEMLEE